MRILALNPFHGGSHQAFLEGWQRHTRHEFTILSLPARHWKWRMRHAAVTFADQISQLSQPGVWDVVFATDMLNLAEFRGLVAQPVRDLPSVVYFHENQLTYPTRLEGEQAERDLHFAFTNFTTALAADAVWFNSEYHRDVFLDALSEWFVRLPDHQPTEYVSGIRNKAAVQPPGIDLFPARNARTSGAPIHLVWAARWEHDKDPETLFAALEQLQAGGVDFRISVLGESFSNVPTCFAAARETLKDRVINWGYLDSRNAYCNALLEADVFVSTARHEFFGIAAAEAIAAGCYPLLPERLAYPELVGGKREFLYDGTSESLAGRLNVLAAEVSAGLNLVDRVADLAAQVEGWTWSNRAREMDDVTQFAVSGRR